MVRRRAEERRVGDRCPGLVGRDGHGLNERDDARVQAMDRDAVTRFHVCEKLRPEIGRHMHLGAVGQDQTVDIATGREVVLRDDTMGRRQLRRVEGGACGLCERRGAGNACEQRRRQK
jgi:hypothetical protein